MVGAGHPLRMPRYPAPFEPAKHAVTPFLRAAGFSPLMNIDKLIQLIQSDRAEHRFSPLMNIDKLILATGTTHPLPRFSPLMNIDKLIPLESGTIYIKVLVL